MADGPVRRTPIAELGLDTGKKARLHRILPKEAGALGVSFGCNVWQREHDESLRFAARLRELLEKYPA